MIIGIGGASRSGKTIMAEKLASHFKNSAILHQDDFVFNESHLPKVNGKIDWEHPRSINFEKLIHAVNEAASNSDHVIVEGFLVFYNQQLLSLFDLKIFLEIDERTFFNRKVNDKRWAITDEYKAHIWESYQKFGTRNKDKVDLVIDTRDIQKINYFDLLDKLT